MFKQEDFNDVSLTKKALTPSFDAIILNDWQVAKIVLTKILEGVKNPVVKMVIQCTIWVGDGLYTKASNK